MENPFAEVVATLNLRDATRRGSKRNDLLPPRHEDAVLGEAGARFSEGLKARMERGRYAGPVGWMDARRLVVRDVQTSTEQIVETDALVATVGSTSESGLADALRGRVPEVYVIGDANQPQTVEAATYQGARVGRAL